jgi:hypothetical protein
VSENSITSHMVVDSPCMDLIFSLACHSVSEDERLAHHRSRR